MPSPKKEKVPMRANPEDETKVKIVKRVPKEVQFKPADVTPVEPRWKLDPWTLILGLVVGFGCGYASVLIVEFVVRRGSGA
jgi:hypothetical protein